MARWIGLAIDPTAGGTRADDLKPKGAVPIAKPTLWIPATAAQVDIGESKVNRDNEVRGRRANAAPVSFASAPKLTFECRTYPKIVQFILLRAFGKTPVLAAAEKAPEAITSVSEPIQSGSLPPFFVWLLREEQLDRISGGIVSEFTLSFPPDGEGTLAVTVDGLFHDVQKGVTGTEKAKEPDATEGEAPGTPDYKDHVETWMLRDMVVTHGAGKTEYTDLGGLDLTFNNGMIDDHVARFRPGKNVVTFELAGKKHKVWFPQRHKIGPQATTGKIDLSEVDVTAEQRRILAHAEALEFTIAGPLLGTTPDAAQALKVTIANQTPTGGGADPLAREGDQRSTYDFSGYVGAESDKDITAELTDTALLKLT